MPPPTVETKPAPPPPAEPARPDREAPSGVPGEKDPSWPLWTFFTPPAGKEVVLPAGVRVTAIDVDPTGRQVAVVTEAGADQSTLSLWDYEHPLKPLQSATLAGRQVLAVAFSKFRHDLYVTSRAGNEHRIERYPVKQGALEKPQTLYKSSAPLLRLVVPFLRFGGAERLFFGREYGKGRYQIVTVRADGTIPYEVTSPSGALTALTDPSVPRTAPSADGQTEQPGPGVEKARSALPMSIHPLSGELIYEAEDHALRTRGYGVNWGESKKVAMPAGALVSFSPNGHFKLRTMFEQPGAELLDPADRVVERIGPELRFTLPPLFLPSGRALVAAVQMNDGVHIKVVPITDKLASVRYLPDMKLPREHLDALSRTGMLFGETKADQIYEPYEQLEYSDCHEEVMVPIYATVDGFMEILSAGFQAVFMITEQKVSRPRLAKFSKLLGDAAKRLELPRLVQIADVTRKVLDGNYATPEGRKIKAEQPAQSTLHTVPEPAEIDFSDFKPRGPYAATTLLQNYFRAFKYMNLLRLTDDEKSKLRGDAELLKAFNEWIDTQRPFMSGSRRPGILDPERQPPAFARTDCIPNMARVPTLFPLSFGIDSEIMESTVERAGVAKDCTVSGRPLPSGLDLMTGLGSPTAQSLQQKEYAMFAELKAVHDGLRSRFGKPLGSAQLPEAWLRLVQILGSDDYVPAGVDPDPWRRRLLSTALGTWTSFRHTTVLVNEEMAAECGGGYEGFESLAREPVRGVVDPLPQSWEQLAVLLEMLSGQASRAVSDQQVGEVLANAAKTARSFRSMAERQMKGVALDEEEYAAIQKYSGKVEHPYLLLKSTLSRFQDFGMVEPDPMTKIVSIASAGPQHLQVALGHPLQVTALLADRGLQVAGTGAVYSYYEVVDGVRMTDAEWRKRLDKAPRPTRPPWAQFEIRKLWSRGGDAPPGSEPN